MIFFFSCTVNCYKSHECKQKEEENFEIDNTPAEQFDEKSYLLEIPDDYKVPDELLERLRHSEEIKTLLGNKNLRDFLSFTHETFNPSGFVRLAMREPLFIEFADACLRTIHPEDYSKKEPTDEEIVEFVKKRLEQED